MMIMALTAGIFVLVTLGMAVGVIVQGKRLKGSCGGIGNNEDCWCEKNQNPQGSCDSERIAPDAKLPLLP